MPFARMRKEENMMIRQICIPYQTTKIDPAALAGPELVVSARIWAFILVKSVFELCIGAAVNRDSTSENPDLKKKHRDI